MRNAPFPTRSSDQHLLLERLANAQVSDERAREIIRSPDAYRAFLGEVAAGLPAYLRSKARRHS